MNRKSFYIIAMLVMFVLVTPAHAALIYRGTDTAGNQLFYDTGLHVTWYDYTKTGPYLDDGSWTDMVAWSDELIVDFGVSTFVDWRLPTTADVPYVWGTAGNTSAGLNVTNSELGHLFYTELGNLARFDTSGLPQSNWGLTNTEDFQNLSADIYWFGTELNDLSAWTFSFYDGTQGATSKGVKHFSALAVHSGDVAAVPEPHAFTLLVISLVGMTIFGVRRRWQLR